MNASSPDGPRQSWLKRFLLWLKWILLWPRRLTDQIDENDEKEVLARLKERAETEPEFAKLIQVTLDIKDKWERRRLLRLLRAGLED